MKGMRENEARIADVTSKKEVRCRCEFMYCNV